MKNWVKDALKTSLCKDKETQKNDDNKLRSAIFVAEIANLLYSKTVANQENDNYKYCNNFIDVKDGKRVSGEWLLDITITEQIEVTDREKKQSRALINSEIIWAVESEAATSLPAFAEDFGKLLCVQAKNYLFLNGLDQKKIKDQQAFIDRRLDTITDLLQKINFHPNDNFYVAFWPSPAQSGGSSLWGTVGGNDLVNIVDAYKF